MSEHDTSAYIRAGMAACCLAMTCFASDVLIRVCTERSLPHWATAATLVLGACGFALAMTLVAVSRPFRVAAALLGIGIAASLISTHLILGSPPLGLLLALLALTAKYFFLGASVFIRRRDAPAAIMRACAWTVMAILGLGFCVETLPYVVLPSHGAHVAGLISALGLMSRCLDVLIWLGMFVVVSAPVIRLLSGHVSDAGKRLWADADIR